MSIYSAGQARILFSVWPKEAEWFVIGGPANANEAQTVKEMYPHMQCIGFEPNDEMRKQQRALHFPGELFAYALWKENCKAELKIPGDRDIGSTLRREEEVWIEGEYAAKEVQARTLDSLEEELGPWNNIVLWLDIECAELEALQGCKRLLEENKILLINTEISKQHMREPIYNYLDKYSFKAVKIWNTHVMPGMCEVIFKKG